MTIARLYFLCLKISETINRLNPALMTDMFKLSDSKNSARKQNILNLNVTRANQGWYVERGLKVLGPKILE